MKSKIIMFCRGVLAVNLMYLVIRGDWINVIVLITAIALTYVPLMMEKFLKVRLTEDIILCCIIFIMLSQWLGTYLRAYDVIGWWDLFLHGISGALASLTGIVLIILGDRKAVLFKNECYGIICTIMFLAGSASAVFWEICEWFGDTFLGTFAQLGSLSDTMEDMSICVIISATFCTAVYLGLKKEKESYFVKQIKELHSLNEEVATEAEAVVE